ncbi:MAG: T9SS type A sorting domain-containing protein [Chitinophagales bacterium]
MTRILTFFCLTLLTCFQIAQADVTVTFNVNMNHTIVSPSGVFVAGGTIGGPGANQLTDPDMDGIYSGSVVVPDNAFVYYIFTNGNCGDYACKEIIEGQACSDPGNFNDRSFQAGTTDMVINTCFGVCSTTTSCPMVDVTFNVNMTGETVAASGVYVTGGAAFGQPGDIPLLDPDADGIYSTTLSLPTDFRDYYTFTNGLCPDYSCKEQVGGQLCANPGHFNDRDITVGAGDMTINTCFGFCSTDGTCPTTYSATFQVDMTKEGANPAGVFMGTSIDGWTGNIQMTDPDMDGIYSVTIDGLSNGFYEYKFINGPGFCCQESVPDACNVVLGSGFQNRGVTVFNGDVVIPPVCFNFCSQTCPETVDVTFRVNMALEDTNPAGVFMGSNLDGWSGNIAMTQLNNSDIWYVTIPLAPGAYEYKFINGPGFCCQESVPDACNVVLGSGFQNRGVTVSAGVSAISLPAVCYNTCDVCPRIGCMDPTAHNFNPRAEIQVDDANTFYWDDVKFTDLSSPYCDTEVKHLGIAAETASAINLTVNTVNATTMEVIIESANADPVDFLLVNGGSGATISPEDFSVPGQIRRTLTWGTPPANITLNILWSKASFGGNWQLSPGDITIPFGIDCSSVDSETTTSNYCETDVTHFGGDPGSLIHLTITNVDATTMEVIIESADADPVDLLIVNAGSGATVSAEDFSVPGQIRRTLTWGTPPPTNVSLNVLWSKVSFGGNWQLSQGDIMVPFAASCSPGGSGTATPDYCNTEVTHFAGDPPSRIRLTISNVDASTMEVIIESADADPVDLLIVNGGSGATISAEDFSVPGQIRRTLTWGTPPANVSLNLLWSKVSFGGNWQLGVGDITVPFDADCSSAGPIPLDLPLTFDDSNINYNLLDFAGAISQIVVDPTNPTNMVVETSKVAPALSFAGTIAGANGLATPIPFTANSTKMTVRVWSPSVGIPVLLKVENSANGGISSEVIAVTTVAKAWETLEFDFSNGAPALNTNNIYDKVVIFFDFGTTYTSSCETCYDGIQNGDETGIDCGGTNPNCIACTSIVVNQVIGISPYNALGTGSIFVTVTAGSPDCNLTYSWTGPGGYTASTEDATGITVAGDYTLTATGCNGNTASVTVPVTTRPTGRGRKASIVSDAIFNVTPNPFTQETLISFNVAIEGEVSLNVYDIAGRNIATLFNGSVEAEQNYQFQFGKNLPVGTYIAALTAASGDVRHIKLVLTH